MSTRTFLMSRCSILVSTHGFWCSRQSFLVCSTKSKCSHRCGFSHRLSMSPFLLWAGIRAQPCYNTAQQACALISDLTKNDIVHSVHIWFQSQVILISIITWSLLLWFHPQNSFPGTQTALFPWHQRTISGYVTLQYQHPLLKEKKNAINELDKQMSTWLEAMTSRTWLRWITFWNFTTFNLRFNNHL